MLWVLTGVTTLVLVVIALMIKDMSKTPTVARPAALSASVRPAAHTGSVRTTPDAISSAPSRAEPSPSASGKARRTRRIADAGSGLSYRLLSRPWRRGCPGTMDTPMFSWSAGEHAVAGAVSGADWYGDACSGLLQQQFQYSGPADLEPTAMSLAASLDSAYYSGLPHYRTLEDTSATLVSGHQAWQVTFLMTYPDATSQGLAWSSEAGAVVVVDRGPGQPPAVFYASVPSNLGPSHVSTLVGSLRLGP
jgi:hypothetical protein